MVLWSHNLWSVHSLEWRRWTSARAWRLGARRVAQIDSFLGLAIRSWPIHSVLLQSVAHLFTNHIDQSWKDKETRQANQMTTSRIERTVIETTTSLNRKEGTNPKLGTYLSNTCFTLMFSLAEVSKNSKPENETKRRDYFVGSWIIGVKQRCIDETRRTSSAEHNIEHGRHLVSPTRPRWRQNGEKERRKKWFNKPKWSASCLPRSAATTRSFCISDLLPTRTTWALSQL